MYSIIYSDKEIEEIISRLRDTLRGSRYSGDTLEITEKRKKHDQKAKIYFTTNAYTKMYALVDAFDTEVEWHALAKRVSETEFKVYDVLVFPHVVSAANVVSDQHEYEEWLNSLDDETFADLRCHGHSHVRMSTQPSGFDVSYREKVVNTLPTASPDDDVFYIFYILNKNRQSTFQIYDITNNAMYDSKYGDVEVDIIYDDGVFASDFIKAAKEIAKPAPPKVPAKTTTVKTCKGVKDKDDDGKEDWRSKYYDSMYEHGYDYPRSSRFWGED